MLICITGIDGCGKGTQIWLLKKALESRGLNIFVSKAYGDSEKESFAHFFHFWDNLAITLIFQGLHRQQYIDAKKAQEDGKIVIADRWDESYLAYHKQFGIFSKRKQLRDELHDLAFEGVKPNLTILIDTTVEEADARMIARGKDFFDSKDVEYHSRMRAAYLEMAKDSGWVIVDGKKAPNKIHQEDILSVALKVLCL